MVMLRMSECARGGSKEDGERELVSERASQSANKTEEKRVNSSG